MAIPCTAFGGKFSRHRWENTAYNPAHKVWQCKHCRMFKDDVRKAEKARDARRAAEQDQGTDSHLARAIRSGD